MTELVPVWLPLRVRCELELAAIIDWLKCCNGKHFGLAMALRFVRVESGRVVMRSKAWQVLLCPECGEPLLTDRQLDELYRSVMSRPVARVRLTCPNNHVITYGVRENETEPVKAG